MCSTFGGLIHADRVHQREEGMHPVEIMLAESQERMLVEVDPGDVELIGKIAEKYDLKWSDIGEVIDEPRYIVRFHGKTVADIPINLLCAEAPLCNWKTAPYKAEREFIRPPGDIRELALKVLSHPEIASKAWIVEQYDHDVQIRTVSLGGMQRFSASGTRALLLPAVVTRGISFSPPMQALQMLLSKMPQTLPARERNPLYCKLS